MHGIEEPVVFIRGQRRGHNQNAALGPLREFISYARQFRRRGGAAPVSRKFVHSDSFARKIIGNLRSDENQIRGRVVGLKMDKVFQHRQRLVFRSVGETSARA